MERKDGYYWVRYKEDSNWNIAYWQNTPFPCWQYNFFSFEFFNGNKTIPFEIDPTPITRKITTNEQY